MILRPRSVPVKACQGHSAGTRTGRAFLPHGGYHRIFINPVVGFHDSVDTSLTLAW